MIKANRRITIDGVVEEFRIRYERAQKRQSPEFFLEAFLKLIKRIKDSSNPGARINSRRCSELVIGTANMDKLPD
ncbi:hypothetical protein TNCV_3466921 [Trichonephila clavipes]|nr:hypothetical protein TNCV_3466921 [Trichonephila clavipes]